MRCLLKRAFFYLTVIVAFSTHEGATAKMSTYYLPKLDHFHKIYLPEHKKDFGAGSMSASPNFFKIEDGWLGYKLHGRL